MSTETKIYIADLAAYNNGYLHGVWIDATDELDDIQDQINAMLKASLVEDAEEYAVHDYEGFDGYSVGEYDSIETLQNIAGFIEEQPELAGALLAHFCGDLDEARKAAEDNYNGCYKSIADYAQDLTEQTSEVPRHLEFYIDYERMGSDMEMNGDIFTIETAHDELHVFWNH